MITKWPQTNKSCSRISLSLQANRLTHNNSLLLKSNAVYFIFVFLLLLTQCIVHRDISTPWSTLVRQVCTVIMHVITNEWKEQWKLSFSTVNSLPFIRKDDGYRCNDDGYRFAQLARPAWSNSGLEMVPSIQWRVRCTQSLVQLQAGRSDAKLAKPITLLSICLELLMDAVRSHDWHIALLKSCSCSNGTQAKLLFILHGST